MNKKPLISFDKQVYLVKLCLMNDIREHERTVNDFFLFLDITLTSRKFVTSSKNDFKDKNIFYVIIAFTDFK